MPDLDKWGKIISHFLKPGGKFIIAEFHPFVWMYDNDFKKIEYSYFKKDAIVEIEKSTYADANAPIDIASVSWNHSISEVFESLINNNLQINDLKEYDYSPYNCFNHTVEIAERNFIIKTFGQKIPLVYSIVATKKWVL